MNKRNNSQPIFFSNARKKKNDKQKHSEIVKLQQSRQELQDLKFKVDQSKPILLSIYDKVKKKQKNYQQKLIENQERCKQAHQLSRQYKTAFEDAIHCLNKNKVIDKYQGLTNYRSASACQLNVSIEGERKFEDKLADHYHSVAQLQKCKREGRGKISSIISEYEEKKRGENKKVSFFAGSVYERYKSKIEGREESKENKESMLNKVRRLSQEIDKDIHELRISK